MTSESMAEASWRHPIYDYLENMPTADREKAVSMASSMMSDGPLAYTVIAIPVAAHQEARQIPVAMAQYASQRGAEPFTVVLGMNWPDSRANEIEASYAAVEQTRREYPYLDIRMTAAAYHEPVMGRIRRDIWNAVCYASQASGILETNDVVSINHDIDLVGLETTAIRNIQRHYEEIKLDQAKPATLPIYGTQTFHTSSANHPNVTKVIRWHDYCVRTRGDAYEAGMVIPLSTYAKLKGFNPSHRLREVVHFVNGVREIGDIRGTRTATSSRRFIGLTQEFGYELWLPGTFSHTDDCRKNLPRPDISKQRAHEIIGEHLDFDAADLAAGILKQITADIGALGEVDPALQVELMSSSDFVTAVARNQMAKTRVISRRILERIVDSRVLAKKMDDLLQAEDVESKARSAYDKNWSPGAGAESRTPITSLEN